MKPLDRPHTCRVCDATLLGAMTRRWYCSEICREAAHPTRRPRRSWGRRKGDQNGRE
jgi:hypothetical protein